MKCAECGREITRGGYLTEEGKLICDNCAGKHSQCSQCGRILSKGRSGLCIECTDSVFHKVINSYGTKVTSIYKNKIDKDVCLNDRYFGMELEFSNITPASAKYVFADLYKERLIYNKSDSSLHGGGVEIVTVPCVAYKLKDIIKRMDFKTLKELAYGSLGDSAGVHFHVSRNTISPIVNTKLSTLFNYSYNRKYKNLLYYLVGRLSSSNGLMDNAGSSDCYYAVGTCSSMRYLPTTSGHGVAFNLGNTHTVEFRLFKSCNDAEQLLSYIEIVEKAIEFAETQPLNMMTIPNFIRYLDLTAKSSWLKDRLKTIIEKYDSYIKVKPIEFSSNTYIDCLSEIKTSDLPMAIRYLRAIPRSILNTDIKWDMDYLENKWRYNRDGSTNKMIEIVENKLKEQMIDKILAK